MTADERDTPAGTVHDAPNQEVVGVGPPWTEGSGGDAGEPPVGDDPVPENTLPEPETQDDDDDALDDMTKDELIDEAGRRGVDVKADWTKADIRKAIDTS